MAPPAPKPQQRRSGGTEGWRQFGLGYSQIRHPQLLGLIDDRAQLVETLPAAEYTELHLPGAINLPLKQLDAQSAAVLDRSRAVVVYCWDGL